MAEAPDMGRPPRRFWKRCRAGFRWIRILLLGSVLAVLVLLTWLRLAGLPQFLRVRIVDELARRGISAQFKDLRFHWFRGLVAEDLHVAWGGPSGPRITIAEADLDIAPPPWHQRRNLIRGLAIRSGALMLPLQSSNEPPSELRVEDMSADLRFLPDDAWEVHRLAATTLGVQLELRAVLKHISGLRRAQPRREPDQPLSARLQALRAVVEEARKWSAAEPPRLEVNLLVDGTNLPASEGDAYMEIPSLRGPRGQLQQLRLSFRSRPFPTAQDPVRTSAILEIGEVQTGHGGLTGLTGRLDLDGPPRPALPTNATWTLSIDHLFLRGMRARDLRLQGTNLLLADVITLAAGGWSGIPLRTGLQADASEVEIGLSPQGPLKTDAVSLRIDSRHGLASTNVESVRVELTTAGLASPQGNLGPLQVAGDFRARPGRPAPDATLGFWRHLLPWEGRVQLETTNLHSSKLDLPLVAAAFRWEPPRLGIESLQAAFPEGRFNAHGALEVLSREANLEFESTFDLHRIDPLLGPVSLENVRRYQWEKPPWIQGTARVRLPAWDDRKPDWKNEVKPTLAVAGRFRVGAGSFKGVPFDRAESSVSFDGATWRLPDLRTERAEGKQAIAVEYHEASREYRVDARGRVMPPVLKPILGRNSANVLDLFEFPQPVDADVSVWGPWSEGTRQAILGTVETGSFLFRGQSFDSLVSRIDYTNGVLVAAPVALRRGSGRLDAEGVAYNFREDQVRLTNVVTTIEPEVVAAAISPGFPAKLAPYRFDHPPRVRVEGTIHPKATQTASLVFDIAGGPFRFWRLSASEIRTRLLWQGTRLTLTNIQGTFYGGTLAGNAGFDLTNAEDGEYHFLAEARDASLGDLLREATPGRDKVAEGIFDLDLAVTSARTSDIKTWNGSGSASVREGLLWDAPVFGFLSPVLNGVIPGLGNNRAEQATATFTITNSVIHTRDLHIACPPVKLLYRGTLDFDQRLDAKVEGQILSELGGFGPLLGLILRPITKLLEFRVTGTLADVQAEPLYIPKLLLLPLQPVKVLKELFGGGDKDTNAPPPAPLNPPPGSPPNP